MSGLSEHTDRLAGRLRELAETLRARGRGDGAAVVYPSEIAELEGLADAIETLPKASRWLDDALNSGDATYRP